MLSLQLWRDWVLLCAKQNSDSVLRSPYWNGITASISKINVFYILQLSLFDFDSTFRLEIADARKGPSRYLTASSERKPPSDTSGARKHWSHNGNQGTDHTCIRGKYLSIFSLCTIFRSQNGIDVESFKEFLRKNRACYTWRCCVIEHNFLPIALLM